MFTLSKFKILRGKFGGTSLLTRSLSMKIIKSSRFISLIKNDRKIHTKYIVFYKSNNMNLINIYIKIYHLNSLSKAKINKVKKQKDLEINLLWPNAKLDNYKFWYAYPLDLYEYHFKK